MDNEFNIGDVVQITDSGCAYTTYSEMAEKMGLTEYVYGNTTRHHPPINSGLKIVAAMQHNFKEGVTLYGVESVSTGDQYIISNEYGNMALVKPTSQYTPWTIYNNTLPMHKLTGSQAVELFLAGKNGRAMEYCIDGKWYDNQNFNFAANGVYRVKCKSESDEFVEKMLTFYNNDVIDDKVIDMLKEAYDNGCRFV